MLSRSRSLRIRPFQLAFPLIQSNPFSIINRSNQIRYSMPILNHSHSHSHSFSTNTIPANTPTSSPSTSSNSTPSAAAAIASPAAASIVSASASASPAAPRVTNTSTSTTIETINPGTEISLETPPKSLDDEPAKPPIKDRLIGWIKLNRPRYKKYAAIGSLLYLFHEMFGWSMTTIEYFISISHPQTAELSFIVGILSTGISIGYYQFSRYLLRYPITDYYRFLLRTIKKNERIKLEFGDSIRIRHFPLTEMKYIYPTQTTPSANQLIRSHRSMQPFRLINSLNGGPRFLLNSSNNGNNTAVNNKYLGWERWWRPQKTQIVCEIQGSNGLIGLLFSECEKKMNTQMKMNYLLIQRLDNNERILIDSTDSSGKWDQNIWKQRLFTG